MAKFIKWFDNNRSGSSPRWPTNQLANYRCEPAKVWQVNSNRGVSFCYSRALYRLADDPMMVEVPQRQLMELFVDGMHSYVDEAFRWRSGQTS